MSANTRSANAKSSPKPKSRPKADAPIQMEPAELDAVHRKAIQSVEAAEKAMSVARANVEIAKRDDRNKAAAKAGGVVGPALLAPSRHVVKLLSGSGLGALFLPCKQVSIAFASLTRHEVNRHQKDVRVAIIHFDLAIALVHLGSLNRKSRPAKSIGESLSKLLKDFKTVIQEFNQFCEGYYESVLKHLQYRSNKDSLNSFAGRIAQLKKSLTRLLSQQAVQHPGKHAEVLVQIELRVSKDRAFYATNEEIAEAFLSIQLKQGRVASVRPDGRVSKQSPGTVKEGAKRKTTASTLKQVRKPVAKILPDAKPTRRGLASKLQGSWGKLVSGKQPKDRADTKSGRACPPKRTNKSAPKTTHAPARGQRTGQQQNKRTSETRGKLQTSRVQGQQSFHTVNTAAKLNSYPPGDCIEEEEEEGEEGEEEGEEEEEEEGEEEEEEYGDSEEEAGDSADPEEEEEYGDSEEEGGDSADPEVEEEYGDSEEEGGDSADPEEEEEYGDSEEEGGDSADPEEEEEYGDSEEEGGDSADPEDEEEYGDSGEEGPGDSAEEEENGDSEEGGDSADPEDEEYGSEE